MEPPPAAPGPPIRADLTAVRFHREGLAGRFRWTAAALYTAAPLTSGILGHFAIGAALNRPEAPLLGGGVVVP